MTHEKQEPNKNSNNEESPIWRRRQRIHELLIALIKKEEALELVDPANPQFNGESTMSQEGEDPARWLERNKRILRKYQSLVRSAITLDALLDAEHCESERNTVD